MRTLASILTASLFINMAAVSDTPPKSVTAEERDRDRALTGQILEKQGELRLLDQRRQAQQQQQQQLQQGTANMADFLNASKQAEGSSNESNKRGMIQTGIGATLMATGGVLLAVGQKTMAAANTAPGPAGAELMQKGQMEQMIGMMLLFSGISQTTSGITAFAQGGEGEKAAAGAQSAGLQRGGEADSPRGDINIPGGFQGQSPEQIERNLPGPAQEALRNLGEVNPEVKRAYLDALSEGKDPNTEITNRTGIPLPNPNDRGPFEELAKNNDVIASALADNGLPVEPALAAINRPDLFSSGTYGDAAKLASGPKLDAATAKKEVWDQFSGYSTTPTSRSAELSSLSSPLDGKKFGLDLSKFYNPKTDLEAGAFGKGEENFLLSPGISKELTKSIFRIMSQRYEILLKDEMLRGAYIVNGELAGIAKKLSSDDVTRTMKDLKDGSLEPTARRRGTRIPAFIP
jgi:hypothetical protein